MRRFFGKKKDAPTGMASKSAPVLPLLDFDQDNREKNDMNGSSHANDDHLHTATATNTAHPTKSTAMPSFTTPRNVSGPLAVDSPVTPADQNAAPWTRPNFHSTPNNSKTSQYIDKLTSENDRLRRELKAEKAAREEETKRVSAAHSKAEDSRAEFQHLQVLAETNARAIERKDRKLDELRATLEAESKRRRLAEQRAEEALKMLGDTRSETQRQLSQAYEQKHLAETNLDACRDGYKRQFEGFEKKIKHLSEQIHQLRKHRQEDADKIKRQAIISDQLHHEMSRNVRTEDKLTNLMDTYKKEHSQEMDRLVTEAERLRKALPDKEARAQQLVEEMEKTRDKMQWVMTQKKRQGGGGGGGK